MALTGLHQLLKHNPILIAGWLIVGLILTGGATALYLFSPDFDWQLPLSRMPAAPLALGLVLAGAIYILCVPLIRHSLQLPSNQIKIIFRFILFTGIVLRALLLFSEPALEDDYNRYLWEGALVANGISPYLISPTNAKHADPNTLIGLLAKKAGPVLDRVNHPNLHSMYPPVAQTVFALSHILSPWNLMVWKLLSLSADIGIMALLLLLLKHINQPILWSTLYWWNPLVLKELANSAHMEGILMVFILLSILLFLKGRYLIAIITIGLAVGTKLWPIIFVPLFLRPLINQPIRLVTGLLLIAMLTLLFTWPVISNAFDEGSFLIAYARYWTTNSALFPVLEKVTKDLLSLPNLQEYTWIAVRFLVGGILSGFILWQVSSKIINSSDFLLRARNISVALVLLSPAQFPWYVIWALPYIVFQPLWGTLVMSATAPIYYLSFYLLATGHTNLFSQLVVWFIWGPVWAAYLIDLYTDRKHWRTLNSSKTDGEIKHDNGLAV